MNQDELDSLLSDEPHIAPSSGFVTKVMDAVERTASTPPPIPFPWKYAIRGLSASSIALLTLAAFGLKSFDVGSTGATPSTATLMAIIEGKAADAAWIAVALLVSGVSVFVSLRFSRSHG
jgi:hypothetical protein